MLGFGARIFIRYGRFTTLVEKPAPDNNPYLKVSDKWYPSDRDESPVMNDIQGAPIFEEVIKSVDEESRREALKQDKVSLETTKLEGSPSNRIVNWGNKTKEKLKKADKVDIGLSAIVMISEIAITIGLVLGLFFFYAVYWTTWEAHRAQNQLTQELQNSWNSSEGEETVPGGKLKPGTPFAKLNIDKIDVHASIVYGVDQAQLAVGPGFYPESTPAPDPGNFALAAHRFGKGGYFQYINRLKICDEVTIETASQVFHYRRLSEMDNAKMSSCIKDKKLVNKLVKNYRHTPGKQIVKPTDVGVVAPVPFVASKGQKAPVVPENQMVPLLTLTSCHPEWSNEERIIIHLVLEKVEEKKS